MIDAPTASHFRNLVGSFRSVQGAWTGEAYGYHPHGVIRRGIIFIDHHNVNDYCGASVILDPTAKIIPADNSRSASISGYCDNAVPRPESGGVLTVYRDGQWVGEDGPWRKIIVDVLADLEREIIEIDGRDHQVRLAKEAQRNADEAAAFEQARIALAKEES